MPILEENFNQSQLSLIKVGETPYVNFNEFYGDYIRMSVFDTDGTFVASFTTKQLTSTDSDLILQIYRDSENNIYVKPNEILDQAEIVSGNYTLKFDFLRNVFTDIYLEQENLLVYSEDVGTDTLGANNPITDVESSDYNLFFDNLANNNPFQYGHIHESVITSIGDPVLDIPEDRYLKIEATELVEGTCTDPNTG